MSTTSISEEKPLALSGELPSISLSRIVFEPRLHAALIIIAIGFLFSYLVKTVSGVVGQMTFAMDDAWIHVTMARNLAEGGGYGIVPHHFLSLSTSPTWTLAVSAAYLIFRDPIKATFFVSLASTCGGALLCYRLILKTTENSLIALTGALLLVFNPLLIWGLGSGMEVPLAVFGLLFALNVYYSTEPDSFGRRVYAPIALAFAAVTRPELFLLLPIGILDTGWRVYKDSPHDGRSKAIRTMIAQGVVTIIALSPYFLLNIASHGKLFPTTYYAKTSVRGIGLGPALASGSWSTMRWALIENPLDQVYEIGRMMLNHNLIEFLLVPVGILAFLGFSSSTISKRGWLLPIALFVLPYMSGITAPTKYFSVYSFRYFAVFPPMLVILSCIGLGLLLREGRKAALVSVCIVLLLLTPFRTTERAAKNLSLGADSTNQLYVEMGKWLEGNLEPTAKLALNDIGGVSYFWRHEIIDVMGLASPEIWPALQRGPKADLDPSKMRAFLKERGITHFIVSPGYYPALTNDRKTFEPIRKWAERFPQGRTISPQVLYKVHWDN